MLTCELHKSLCEVSTLHVNLNVDINKSHVFYQLGLTDILSLVVENEKNKILKAFEEKRV